jgi:hypothetical protein
MRDPLARKLRTVLRNSNVWSWLDKPGEGDNDGGRKFTNVTGALPKETGIKVVYSTQSPVCPLEPLTKQQKEEGASNFGAVDHFRVRVMPVLGSIPALFGMTAASYVLCEIGQKNFSPLASRRMTAKTVRKVRDRLKKHEWDNYQVDQNSFNVSEDDVAYIMEHVWHMRCAYTGVHMEGSRAKKLCLRRWNISLPASIDNLILLTEPAAVIHDRMTSRSGTSPNLENDDEEGEDDEPPVEVLKFAKRAIDWCILAQEYHFERVKWADDDGKGKGSSSSTTMNGLVKHLGATIFQLIVVIAVALSIGYILKNAQ